MKKTMFGFVLGLLIGAAGAFTLGGGAMAGIGIATGLSSGICMTVEAAQDLGLMSPAQVDQVLTKAAETMSGTVDLPDGEQIAGSAQQCKEFMEKIRAQK